jgi:hypothetical protein
MLRRVIQLGLLVGFMTEMLSARVAYAASAEEKAGARAAATQGEAAFDAKRWADAVDLFSRAESLVHSPVHLLYKARALAQLGQLVKARETYLDILREQPAVPSPALTKAQADAKLEDQALEPRLGNVTIKVEGPGAANAAVTMDGGPVPAALVGLSHPVDPGEHHFQATTSGAQSDDATLSLKEGGAGTITLTLKPIATAAPAAAAPVAAVVAPAPAPAAAANSASVPPNTNSNADTDTGATSSGNGGLRAGSYVAFGVGAVGLALGTVFALSAKSKYDDANGLCTTNPCNLSATQAAQRTQFGKDGDSAKTLSIVGFVAGGVGVVAGTTLFVLGNGKSGSEHADVRGWLGLGSVGLSGDF